MQTSEGGPDSNMALPFSNSHHHTASPHDIKKRIERLSRIGIDKSIAKQVVSQAPQCEFEKHVEDGLIAMTQAMRAIPQVKKPTFALRGKQRKHDLQVMHQVMERMKTTLDQVTTYPLARVQVSPKQENRTAQLERGMAAGRSSTLPHGHAASSSSSPASASTAAASSSSSKPALTTSPLARFQSESGSGPNPSSFQYQHHANQHANNAAHDSNGNPYHTTRTSSGHVDVVFEEDEIYEAMPPPADHAALYPPWVPMPDRHLAQWTQHQDQNHHPHMGAHIRAQAQTQLQGMDTGDDDDDDDDDNDDDDDGDAVAVASAAENDRVSHHFATHFARGNYPASVEHRPPHGTTAQCHQQQQQQEAIRFYGAAHVPNMNTRPACHHGYTDSIIVYDNAPLYAAHTLAPCDPSSVHPSEETQRRSHAAKHCITQDFFYREKRRVARIFRERKLQEEMLKQGLELTQHKRVAAALMAQESDYLRLARAPLEMRDFDRLSALGRGAFGEVSLVRNRTNGFVYAMKAMKKITILRHKQADHVKSERDILADADNEWVVRLFYALQDRTHLYFVMEFLPGGDLMSLLIKSEYFPEQVARFYLAELVMAISSVHALGFIHRDIKPDNVLIDAAGHIKLTDFGLCTTFRFKHDSSYYNGKEEAPLLREFETECTCSVICSCPEWAQAARARRELIQGHHARSMAHSLVGTPNYIAPEVFGRRGYNHSCDWWSLGVILYEMLVGYPPFVGPSPEHTREKVINWRTTLKIPQQAHFGLPAKDLIMRLCCDVPDRLGTKKGVREIKEHPFFEGIAWDRTNEPPLIPDLNSDDDVSYFQAGGPGAPNLTRAPPPQPEEDLRLEESPEMQQRLEENQYLFRHFNFRRFWTNPN